MDYKKQIHEMLEKITDESALKVIYDFVEVPYSREILKSDIKITVVNRSKEKEVIKIPVTENKRR